MELLQMCINVVQQLLLTMIALIWIATSVCADWPTPKAFWPCERTEGNSQVRDAMGQYDGVLTGGTEIVEAGYDGRALSFNGSDAGVIIEDSEHLLAGDEWTVSLWFCQFPQSDNTGSTQRVMIASSDAQNFSLNATRLGMNQLNVHLGEHERYYDFPFDMGWHHAVVVRDSDVVELFVDGVTLGSFPAGDVEPARIHLGHDGSSRHPMRHFNGILDEVLVFDKPLSSDTIASMYELRPPFVSEPFTGGVVGGQLGYHTFRIPSLLTATDGTILAFAEGRVDSGADFGNIDIVLRRSTDGGKTWGPIHAIWDDGPHTCGNPAPLVDRDTGRIWMVGCHSLDVDTQKVIQAGKARRGRTVWTLYSDDHGKTWSNPVEITSSVKPSEAVWFATGPGVSMQHTDGTFIVPANFNSGDTSSKMSYSFVFYSEDHGGTWLSGGQAGPSVSESHTVELTDGRLLQSMRRVGNRKMLLCQAYSPDRGLTWSDVSQHPQLISPGGKDVGFTGGCQACMIRYTRADRQDANRLLFSNPANSYPYGPEGRLDMTVRLSTDEAKSWAYEREIHPRYSGYSCLTVLDDLDIGLLYAWGDRKRYQRIVFNRINLPWLTGGAQSTPQIPLPPRSLAGTIEGEDVMLEWPPVEHVSGYRVYRYVAGTPGTAPIVAELTSDSQTFTDRPPSGDTDLFYRIEPYNNLGCPPIVPVTRVDR
jgi:sialidase-1